MIRKLRIKIIAVAMIALTVVLVAIIGAINIGNYVKIVGDADRALGIIVGGGGRFPDFDENRGHTPPNGMSPEMPFETRFFTVDIDSTGNVVSVNTDKIAAIDDDTAKAYALKVYNKNSKSGFVGNYRYLLNSSEDESKVIFVDCGRNLDTFNNFLLASILISVIGLAVVFALVWVFSKIVTKPIAETYDKQKRFITDANHELKTPLTVIGADCDVIEMENGKSEWTTSIRQEVDKLTDLTNKLVFLSRMDEQSTQENMTEFSLSEVADEVSDEYKLLCNAKNKNFTADIQRNLSIKGDMSLIKELLNILLENAVKYSIEDGDIKLKLSSSGKAKTITVSNLANEINQQDLDRLFDRFYRPDSSRNSSTGGSGIGLSVAKAITELHKGKISVRYDSGVITFTVVIS